MTTAEAIARLRELESRDDSGAAYATFDALPVLLDIAEAAENLCGDVYLYHLAEITGQQLRDTQAKTLHALDRLSDVGKEQA